MLERTGGKVRIAYDRAGTGPLVVFLHGIGGNRHNWDGQLPVFAKRYCAVAWDARGYGDSDDTDHPLQFRDFADDLARLLDHLRAERAHVVGLSMGGMIAQDFYGRHPHRAATLVLADTNSGFGATDQRAQEEFVARRLRPLEAGITMEEFGKQIVETLVARDAITEARATMMASYCMVRRACYVQALRAVMATDFRPIHPRIKVPALVVVGSEDRVTPLAESASLVRAIAGAEQVVIPGSGHMANLEKPGEFNSAVVAFLDRHAQLASVVE